MNRFLVFLSFLLLVHTSAFAEVFSSDATNIGYLYEPQVSVLSGVSVSAPNSSNVIALGYPQVTIINNGTINGNIDISGNFLNIRNTGTINGQIINTVPTFGSVTQLISSGTEFVALNVSDDINLYANVSGMNNLTISGLNNLGAGHFTISNSTIYVDDFAEWRNWNSDVVLSAGTGNHLVIQDISTINSGEVFKHVSNINNIVVDDNDILHVVKLTKMSENVVVLNVVRETDYSVIFNDNRGTFLQNIRAQKPNDRLLMKMDSANSLSELNSIMNSSYRFNHKILMRPLYVMNSFLMFDSVHDNNQGELYFLPYYIGGDKTSGTGGVGYIGGKYENVYAALGFHLNKLNYKNSTNNFDVMVYGPELKAKVYLDDLWVRGIAGFSVAKYKADNIYHSGNVKNNPNGNTEYIAIDVGKDYSVSKNLNLSGFAGGNIQRFDVLDSCDVDAALRIGGAVQYAYEMIGIKYEYTGSVAVATNGDVIGGLKFGFWSVADEAGMSFDVDATKNKYDTNYRLSVNIKTMF